MRDHVAVLRSLELVPTAAKSGASASDHLTIADVEAAANRIGGKARRTPTLSFSSLDLISNARVYLKPENFQRTGSFKFGALNRVLQLTDEERQAGIITSRPATTVQPYALAASMVGATATVVVPTDASRTKVDAIVRYGAEVRFYERGAEEPGGG